MSNHEGSYMLNNVISLLKEENVFDLLGKEKTLNLLNKIRKIGCNYDCNNGEILENIGEELNVCYSCWNYSDELEYGNCKECRSHWIR